MTTIDVDDERGSNLRQHFYIAIIILAAVGGAVWSVGEWRAYSSIDQRLERIEQKLEVRP